VSESVRLGALARYQVLDSAPEARFDDLTQLAARVCRMPVALMSLVDDKRAWFKSKVGLDVGEIPKDLAPCVYAIETRRVFHVEDMQHDPRFQTNGLVQGGLVRSYAGAPLITPDGHVLGTLCVIDGRPRKLDAADVALLESLARQAVAQLELSLKLREVETVLEGTRRLQAQLVASERLAAMGTLTASVGHEINNPLVYLGANLELLSAELAGPDGIAPRLLPELRELVGDARAGVERIRRVVQGLASFSRADALKRDPTDPAAALALALDMAAHEINHRATLVRELGPLPLVAADQARLGQVFLNLIVNAAQAIPAGAAMAHQITARTRTTEKGEAQIAISDNGCGIAPEHLPRIFEPFFTTKDVGAGTGLGLSVCHGIVSALGGSISVQSELGRGSTFTVTLPGVSRAPQLVEGAAVVPASTVPRLRVLVIDDDPRVAESIARLLHRHQPTVATSASAALGLLRAGRDFDAILCDLMMPESTGIDFQRQLLLEFPSLGGRLAFLTGGAFTAEARAFLDGSRTPRLEKPFPRADLEALVRRLAE
jgi:signal transduction histidine kinase